MFLKLQNFYHIFIYMKFYLIKRQNFKLNYGGKVFQLKRLNINIKILFHKNN
jgi:hypothetical protein